MNRGFLSGCMAFAGIIGVLILFNVCIQIPGVLLHAGKAGTYDDTFWGAIGADLIGSLIGAGLVVVALRIRGVLRDRDAVVEQPIEEEKW